MKQCFMTRLPFRGSVDELISPSGLLATEGDQGARFRSFSLKNNRCAVD